MSAKCPVCNEDISDRLYAEEIHDFEKDHEIECPECGKTILASMEWNFVVKAKKGTFVCPKCGDDWFDDTFVYDIHVNYCKGKPVILDTAKPQEETKQ